MQLPSIVIDGEHALAAAIRVKLPNTVILEDYRHLKKRVLDKIGGTVRYADFDKFIQPLINAATHADFQAVFAKVRKAMPAKLLDYLVQGHGSANRSVLQRIQCKSATPLVGPLRTDDQHDRRIAAGVPRWLVQTASASQLGLTAASGATRPACRIPKATKPSIAC